jgi:hypothetical protein
MMEITDIRNALGYSSGIRFVTKTQVANAFGIKNKRLVDKYLKDLDRVDGKYYLLVDVARKIKECITQ